MKPSSPINQFLEQHIGLTPESVGDEPLHRAMNRRMARHTLEDEQQYLALLGTSEEERQALFEEVVVLETWFFRNRAAFEYLAGYVKETRPPEGYSRPLRLLSLPCATGEEAYSLAITLLEAGLEPAEFRVDALDLSLRALKIAKEGTYGPASFRGDSRDLELREQYFHASPQGDKFRIDPRVGQQVHFARANVLNAGDLPPAGGLDIIFCRNLLIYLSENARRVAVRNLRALLPPKGMLFLGHAERGLVCHSRANSEFEQIREPNIFACRKLGQARRARKPLPKTEFRFPALPPSRGKAEFPLPTSPLSAESSEDKSDTSRAVPPGNTESVVGHRAETYVEQARQLADRGRLQEARAHCEQCLRDYPGHAQAYFLLGLIYQAGDQEKQAEDYFNKTLYLDPRHEEALHYLAFIVEHRDGPRAAARLRQRLKRLREHSEQA